MKTATKIEYIADDGAVFTNTNDCLAHETLVRRVNAIMGALPDGCRLRSDQYLQHDLTGLRAVASTLLLLIEESFKGDDKAMRQVHAAQAWLSGQHDLIPLDVALSNIGFWGDRCNYFKPPLHKAWFRLLCIDFTTGHEYEQPYYAAHPEETKNFACVNP